jgi:hypothetical protein
VDSKDSTEKAMAVAYSLGDALFTTPEILENQSEKGFNSFVGALGHGP